MRADKKQTDRHTDTLIAILCTTPRTRSKCSKAWVGNSASPSAEVSGCQRRRRALPVVTATRRWLFFNWQRYYFLSACYSDLNLVGTVVELGYKPFQSTNSTVSLIRKKDKKEREQHRGAFMEPLTLRDAAVKTHATMLLLQ